MGVALAVGMSNNMSLLSILVAAQATVSLAAAAAHAHAGHDGDEPAISELYEHAGATAGAPDAELQGLVEQSAAPGVLARRDFVEANRAWIGAHAEGFGYLAMPAEIRGVRLAAHADWMLAPVDLTLASDTQRVADRLGIAALGYAHGAWSVGLGQLVMRHNSLVQTETRAANIGWVRFADAVQLDAHVRLEVEAYLTANLFQETRVDAPMLRGIADGMRACSSQSEIGLSLRLVVAELLTLEAFAIDQDDPFHFVSGAECFGDGAIWVQGSSAGLGLDVDLGRHARLGFDVRWASAEVGYDLEKRHALPQVYGAAREEHVAAGVTFELR